MYAILNGKSDVLTELIPLGADVNIQANVRKSFPKSHHYTAKTVWYYQI